MKDGLYQVTTPYLCAGFVIKDGRLVTCAPILRKRFHYWKTIAVYLNNSNEPEELLSRIYHHHRSTNNQTWTPI